MVAYIDGLGQRPARVSSRSDIKYHFKVVDKDTVNAFAVPGGYVYVNRALIAQVGNESELAGVLGHEVGPIVGRHGANQISKQYGLTFITEMILGGGGSSNSRQIAAQFAGVGGVLGTLHYSRKAEREADLLAVQLMYDTSIDPKGLTTFSKKCCIYMKKQAVNRKVFKCSSLSTRTLGKESKTCTG